MTTRRAPASMAFSTSSFTTDAGRSTTSPAAIWLASSVGSRVIRPTSDPALASEEHQHRRYDAHHDQEQPPELHAVAAGELRQVHVHPVNAGHQGQRHEDGGHDGENL